MNTAVDPSSMGAAMGAAGAGPSFLVQHSTDLILQLPMAAGFAFLATISLLQVLLPGPLSRRLSSLVMWASRNTVPATILATAAVGMALAVAATAAQLKYLYLSNAPPGAVASGQMASKGMSATAGLSATAGEGQKLWTTLLLGLSDMVLCVNIWGHAREQHKTAAAREDSRAVRKQAANNLVAAASPAAVAAPARGAAAASECNYDGTAFKKST